jgi:hypothetical protein
MSNVIKFPVRPPEPSISSNIDSVSDLDLGHEVARYCLERMFGDKEITESEYEVATQFVDFSYLIEKFNM